MSALELEVYEILKNRFSDKEAAKVIEYFESKAEQKISEKKDVFMTKDDKVDFFARIESVRVELITRIESVKAELITRIESDKAELITRIESSKSDTIKWMFIFWIGQLAATTAIVFALLNAYLKK